MQTVVENIKNGEIKKVSCYSIMVLCDLGMIETEVRFFLAAPFKLHFFLRVLCFQASKRKNLVHTVIV
jgi:hypothetical protein